MHDLAALGSDPDGDAGRLHEGRCPGAGGRDDGVGLDQVPPTSTLAARPARQASAASPALTVAPFRWAARIRASVTFRPSTRAAPGMCTAASPGAQRREQCLRLRPGDDPDVAHLRVRRMPGFQPRPGPAPARPHGRPRPAPRPGGRRRPVPPARRVRATSAGYARAAAQANAYAGQIADSGGPGADDPGTGRGRLAGPGGVHQGDLRPQGARQRRRRRCPRSRSLLRPAACCSSPGTLSPGAGSGSGGRPPAADQ